MEFFVPDADPSEAEELWQAMRGAVSADRKPSDRRIYEIHYRHNGGHLVATVGKPEPLTRAQILVILEANPFYICTRRRNLLWGEGPVLAGIPDKVIEFKPADTNSKATG